MYEPLLLPLPIERTSYRDVILEAVTWLAYIVCVILGIAFAFFLLITVSECLRTMVDGYELKTMSA